MSCNNTKETQNECKQRNMTAYIWQIVVQDEASLASESSRFKKKEEQIVIWWDTRGFLSDNISSR